MSMLSRMKLRSILILLAMVLFAVLLPAMQASAEPPYKTCAPSEVHPIWWKGRIRYDAEAKNIETKEMITIPKGTKVTVVSNNRTGRRRIMLKDKTVCTIARGAVSVYAHKCTPGDYSKETKIAFVNSKNLSSQTKYLIWVSTDMQSLTVFKGSNRHWEYVKSYKCSSGMLGWASPIGKRRIIMKTRVLYAEEWNSYLQYFLSFGGSGIHKWPGSGGKKSLGKEPCSHSCVRLSRSASQWMYKHIPVGTCLLIY